MPTAQPFCTEVSAVTNGVLLNLQKSQRGFEGRLEPEEGCLESNKSKNCFL